MKIVGRWIAAATVCAIAAFSATAYANTTSYWTQAGIERFYNGQFFGTALTQDGRVTLGFKMEEILKSTEPYFWSMAYDSRGTLWAGSGNKAILYKMKKVGEPEEAAVLPGMGITAVAIDSKNNVYAAVMPGARIFKINYKGDKEEYAMLPATYIWDMEFDDKGNLFCVTGVSAGAFEITPDKRVIPLYNSSESHFLSMFLDGKGNLYTGTSPGGLVLKINIKEAENFTGVSGTQSGNSNKPGWTHPPTGQPDDSEDEEIMIIDEEETAVGNGGGETGDETGDEEENDSPETVPEAPADPRVTVLLDMEEDEAYRLLRLPDGNFLVAANRNQAAPPNPQNPRTVSRNEPLSFPIGQAIMQQPQAAAPARMYLVTPEGRQRLILEIPDPYIMVIHSLGGDDVLVGTGNQGRIYTMNVKSEEAMLQSLPVRNVLSMAGTGKELRIGTGNPGSIYAPAGGRVDRGQYLSSINDAASTAFYGNMDAVASIPDGASIEFQTHTGNTPDPMDGTWSKWSEPSSEWPFQVKSTPGRYIQYMATMKPSAEGKPPRLSEARIYYITDNQAPEIRQLQVLPQPEQRPAQSPQGGAQNKPQGGGSPSPAGPPQQNNGPPQGSSEMNLIVGTVMVSNQITFRWQAEDPDADTLRYTLEFRKLPATAWVEIDEYIYGAEYGWQTESLPDGTYEARLTVTDEDSNPGDRALSDDWISDPFIIDHTRPGIKVDKTEKIKGGGFRISAIATDPTSTITCIEYSLNDLEWHLVFPKDMIFDSTAETVVFTIDEPDDDDNTVLIRARDFVGNTGSVSVPLMK